MVVPTPFPSGHLLEFRREETNYDAVFFLCSLPLLQFIHFRDAFGGWRVGSKVVEGEITHWLLIRDILCFGKTAF